jgi:hypothetical protein
MPDIKTLEGTGKANIRKLGDVEVVAFVRSEETASLLTNWRILSNEAVVPITMPTQFGERIFPTVQHYRQYMKDPGSESLLNAILKADPSGKVLTTPDEALAIAKTHLASLPPAEYTALNEKFNNGGMDKAVEAAVRAKVEQHKMENHSFK